MTKSAFKEITLITRPGQGGPVVEKLFQKGLTMIDLQHARGSLVGGPVDKNGSPIESQQEILTCVVPAAQAPDCFALIYEWAEVDQPHGGFMYMRDLLSSSEVRLP